MIYRGQAGADAVLQRLQQRAQGDLAGVEADVKRILSQVREQGDAALGAFALQFDDTDYNETPLRVSEAEIDAAYAACPAALLDAVRLAVRNLTAYHQKQLEQGYEVGAPGAQLRQIIRPLERVGIYAPGGTAAYPSSVLMNAVPAKIAGVKCICMATPPKKGTVPPLTLVAARESGVDEIYRMGGAQAIAAFAYGTETVPRVDKVTGPGNAYVAMAKKLVYGDCGIDAIAGPSEVLIVADETASPVFAAADMLSQAEHDVRAAAILTTTSPTLAEAVERQIKAQLATLPRRETAQQSIETYGAIVVLDTLEACMAFSNAVAPEHLEILTADPEALLPAVQNAGGIFLGAYAPEPLGDYLAGTNHVLPTGGTARFSSPLGVYDFLKRSSVVCYEKTQLQAVSNAIVAFAQAEGLDAHARAVAIRFEGGEEA